MTTTRRLADVDEIVLSLYADLTTGEISAHVPQCIGPSC